MMKLSMYWQAPPSLLDWDQMSSARCLAMSECAAISQVLHCNAGRRTAVGRAVIVAIPEVPDRRTVICVREVKGSDH